MNVLSSGAFSIFHRTRGSDSDSIWLTAYVAKCFGKAKHWYQINDYYIYNALTFLKSKQNSSGEFPEYGVVSYYLLRDSQSSHGLPLTAFTVIAFLESDHKTQFNKTIDKSLRYISQKFDSLTDNYAIAISTYALALGQHDSANRSLNALILKSTQKGSKMFWTGPFSTTMIETAAYAILAFVSMKRETEAVPVVNWLVSKRNPSGGFDSTQDTVIGLQALAEISHKLFSKELKIDVKLTFDKSPQINFKIDRTNNIKSQKKSISPNVRSVSWNVNGTGVASLQVALSYKTKYKDADENFHLTVAVKPYTGIGLLHLTICARYIPQPNGEKQTNMALIEVSFPSGYIYDDDFELSRAEHVKVCEFRNCTYLKFIAFLFISIDSNMS